MAETSDTYWAARPAAECLREAMKRVKDYYEWLNASGRLNLYRTALREYYAGAETGGKIGTAGEQEEFTTMKLAHVHNLGEHLVTAIAGQPPHAQPQALNNDSESTSQTVVATGLCEQAVTQKGLEEVSIAVTRMACVLSEGYGSPVWDTSLGEDYAVDPTTRKAVKSGDVRYRYYDPTSVVRDTTRANSADHQWLIVRDEVNRWDLIAERPELAEQIRGVTPALEDKDHPRLVVDDKAKPENCDTIFRWTLFHDRTPALPDGRQMSWVGTDVLLDQQDPLPLQTREVMVYRMSPEEQIGTERGNTTIFDLLAPQHVINASYSSALSAINSLGCPAVWQKPGQTEVEEYKAFRIIKCTDKPEPLSLLEGQSLKATLEFGRDIISQTEILSGVNAVRRGNVDATGKLSGAAYALLDAKFLDYALGLQKAYKRWVSKMLTATVWLYQDNATVPIVTRTTGKSNRVYVQRFIGNRGEAPPGVRKIDRVQRVDIELGNPLMRTTSGRIAVADTLLERGLIKTAEQYMAVLTTGRLEPATEGPAKELDNIKAENEMLADGQVPIAWVFDNHPLHINEHTGVMSSPEARAPGNPAAAAALEHIAAHLKEWAGAPLDGLAARGIPPPPAPGGVTPMMAAGMGAPAPANGPQQPKGGPGVPDQVAAPPGAGEQPNLPQMPKNPQSGEPAAPGGAGMAA